MISLPFEPVFSNTHRTVAIFDVLGVKKRIESGEAAEVARSYHKCVRMAQMFTARRPLSGHELPSINTAKSIEKAAFDVQIFSDTILVISEDASFDAMIETLNFGWRLLQCFIAHGIPLRGGIAFGEMIVDDTNQIHVGAALTRAHLLEAAQTWAGCAIDESVWLAFPKSEWAKRNVEEVLDFFFPVFLPPIKAPNELPESNIRVLNWRANLVCQAGLGRVFGIDSDSDNLIHPYVVNMLNFAKSMRYYAHEEWCPLEFRLMFVGHDVPPFDNGDDY